MMSDKVEVKKGLEGVIVDETQVSKVMPETNSLTYRGYPVQDLADNANFEEVAYLMWHGELPNKTCAAQPWRCRIWSRSGAIG